MHENKKISIFRLEHLSDSFNVVDKRSDFPQ